MKRNLIIYFFIETFFISPQILIDSYIITPANKTKFLPGLLYNYQLMLKSTFQVETALVAFDSQKTHIHMYLCRFCGKYTF